ncbi:MAG TPA: SEC-C domain-containing protein [Candidatus Sumerlaeota bacterium]|nr:SEC-C domain-containing protein [Candidatus Sumerlaeota bacterium]HPS00467.1 SEC-C domain-containing protein [Candidatus Sumerlaeota bacterium]
MSTRPKPNQPCPCGSGLKYKKCCGKPGEQPRRNLLNEDLSDSDLFGEKALWPENEFPEFGNDGDDFADEIPEEDREMFDRLIHEKLTPAMLSNLMAQFGEILLLDPSYRCFRLNDEDSGKIMELVMKNPNPDKPFEFDKGPAKKVLTTIRKKRIYREMEDEVYSLLQDDFETSDDMEHKTLCHVLMTDLERLESQPSGISLFWIQLAQVSAVESARLAADTMEQCQLACEFLSQDSHRRQILGIQEETGGEETFQRILGNSRLSNRLFEKLEQAYESLTRAIENNEIVLRLSPDWALPALVFKPFLEPSLLQKLGEELPDVFPVKGGDLIDADYMAPYIFNPRFIQDCQAALRAAVLPPNPDPLLELAHHVFCRATRLHGQGLSAGTLNTINHKFYDPLETLAKRYPQEVALLKPCMKTLNNEEEKILRIVGDDAINAALKAGNPTRAEALAVTAQMFFLDQPERRFHFAKRVDEITRTEEEEMPED